MRVTLNLISPEHKASLRKAHSLAHAERMLFTACLVAAFCAATILGIRMMLATTRDSLVQNSSGEATETSEFAEQARQINTYMKRINDLEDATIAWSSLLQELTLAAPSGVHYTTISVDRTGSIRLSGMAQTRADVLALKTVLESSPLLTDVQAPLSNILTQKDVKFDFDMKLAGWKAPEPLVPAKKP